MATKRQKREQRGNRTGASKRRERHKSGFQGTSVQLSDGVSFYSPKKANARLEIIEYIVPKGGGGGIWDEGDAAYERTFYGHRIGPDNN